jgi:sortase (surface protein transpeptidase)
MTFFLKELQQVLSFLFIIGFSVCIFIKQRNTIIILKDKCSILEKQALEKQTLEKQATKSTQTNIEKTEKAKTKKPLPPPPPIEIPPW